MRIPTLFAFVVLVTAAGVVRAADSQFEPRGQTACAPAGTLHTRTTLYFGLARPAGTISEKQWKTFVRDEVTARFPQGFTIWEAHGQWRGADGRISRERARVLLLVHENTAAVRDTLVALVESYKRTFQQESVLWETAMVCAAF
jgi:hypothetical protein